MNHQAEQSRTERSYSKLALSETTPNRRREIEYMNERLSLVG
jgi:hypothetical protein